MVKRFAMKPIIPILFLIVPCAFHQISLVSGESNKYDCSYIDNNPQAVQLICGNSSTTNPRDDCHTNLFEMDPSWINIDPFKELKVLKASQCKFDDLACSGGLACVTFMFQNLRELDISFGQINDQTIYFPMWRFDYLEKLNLAHNQLSVIHDEQFRSASRLTEIDLSFNNIVTIETNAFKSLDSLTAIDLSHNNITSLNNGTFSDHRNLAKLDLSYNPLKELDGDTFPHYKGLMYSWMKIEQFQSGAYFCSAVNFPLSSKDYLDVTVFGNNMSMDNFCRQSRKKNPLEELLKSLRELKQPIE